jgi:hypothetical protein
MTFTKKKTKPELQEESVPIPVLYEIRKQLVQFEPGDWRLANSGSGTPDA